MRLFDGSLGFHVSPRKTARVKIEFTWTMPSRAEMWMLVARDLLADWDDGGDVAIAAGDGRREKLRASGQWERFAGEAWTDGRFSRRL